MAVASAVSAEPQERHITMRVTVPTGFSGGMLLQVTMFDSALGHRAQPYLHCSVPSLPYRSQYGSGIDPAVLLSVIDPHIQVLTLTDCVIQVQTTSGLMQVVVPSGLHAGTSSRF